MKNLSDDMKKADGHMDLEWQTCGPDIYTGRDICVQQQVEHNWYYGHEGNGMRRTKKEEALGVDFENFQHLKFRKKEISE